MESSGLYTLVIDGETYQSSSPITEEQIRRKVGKMESSGAFANGGEGDDEHCHECEERAKSKMTQEGIII